MNGSASTRKDKSNTKAEDDNAEAGSENDDAEAVDNTAASISDVVTTMHFTSAPTTKCRVQLKDVIDLAEPGGNDIKLIRVSNLEPRY